MEIKFKEKTFEKYFSYEVARRTNITYSPDQCDEAFLGFDDAFFVPYHWLMRWTPYLRRSRWRRMTGLSIQDFEHITAEISGRMPPFRFNLFVQYKRPVFLQSHASKEWSYWLNPYYRYQITPHQQAALEKIEALGKGRAATVYASPAFWKETELWDMAKRQEVIDNSNIASVGRLLGHNKYTYAIAGFQGKGHSTVSEIVSPTLDEIITRGLDGDALYFHNHIKQTAKLIREIVHEDDIGKVFFQKALDAMGVDVRDDETFLGSLATINAFSESYEVSFFAMG